MYYKVMTCVLTYLYCAITLCSTKPVRRFIDLDCDKVFNCSEDHTVVCGTDGETYKNRCEVEAINQKKLCEIADFNPVVVAHDGPCQGNQSSTPTTADVTPTRSTTPAKTTTQTQPSRTTSSTTTVTTDRPSRTTDSPTLTRAP